ncbi:MAG: hypothetical protein WCO05_04265 [Candidatus Moraniibacteriota bacterium]
MKKRISIARADQWITLLSFSPLVAEEGVEIVRNIIRASPDIVDSYYYCEYVRTVIKNNAPY